MFPNKETDDTKVCLDACGVAPTNAIGGNTIRTPGQPRTALDQVGGSDTWENARNYIYCTNGSKVLESPIAPCYTPHIVLSQT